MKITDSLITALLKSGVIGSAKNFKTEVNIPHEEDPSKTTKILITAENVEIKLLKE